MEIKLISLDMFQTLVNVSAIRHDVWRIILGDRYRHDHAEKMWDLTTARITDYFSKNIMKEEKYVTVKSIFSQFYKEIFREYSVDFDHEAAAAVLAHHHNFAAPYEDTDLFIDYIKDKYTYCISSDADNDMIENIAYLENSHRVFTSESLKCYKSSKDNAFFKHVLAQYDFKAHELLHIGDSVSDIINPKKLGMKTCWINRNNRTWQHPVAPDLVCGSLEELRSVL